MKPPQMCCRYLPVYNVPTSKWFIKCAFRLKKEAAVRELLLRKVWKVPFCGCVGAVHVMRMCCAPNFATTCIPLLGEHHCNSFQLHMQRKDGSLSGCRFWAPGKCTPQSATAGDLETGVWGQFCRRRLMSVAIVRTPLSDKLNSMYVDVSRS